MQKKSGTFLWLVLLGLAIGGGAYAYKHNNFGLGRMADVNVEVERPVLNGQMARIQVFKPRKSMPSLVFLAGLQRTTSLENLKGQWTLVNMWASWCAPCIKELPSLQRLHDAYAGQGFRVIAISLDTASTPSDIETLISSRRFGSITRNWDHAGEIFKLVSNNGAIPVSFIIDPEGNVFGQLNGDADWATPDAFAFVDSLLGRTAATGPTQVHK